MTQDNKLESMVVPSEIGCIRGRCTERDCPSYRRPSSGFLGSCGLQKWHEDPARYKNAERDDTCEPYLRWLIGVVQTGGSVDSRHVAILFDLYSEVRECYADAARMLDDVRSACGVSW